MDLKQGEENVEFMKDENSKNRNYILQWNKKTKVAIGIIVIVLLILVSAVVLTSLFLEA